MNAPQIRTEQVSASFARDEILRPQSVTLVLPYPISANRYWATRIITPKGSRRQMALTYVTPEAKQYREDCAKLAIAAGVRPLAGRVCIELQLYPHRPLDWAKRARKDPDYWADTVQCIDLGNCEKVLSDALNGIAWADDKQHHRIVKDRMEPDEHGARVVVTISPIVREAIAPELFP
ncbi:RusA family crossover junction endodeoxyribonuclease [Rhodanobacter sp. FW102-FHT14D06]|uniref:RusA family crossover junction endodeoxyribonuclease n=2 Tax=unclassified Rhodanobacter TaxID=2621553 RepID=A0AB74USB5_9GAMM